MNRYAVLGLLVVAGAAFVGAGGCNSTSSGPVVIEVEDESVMIAQAQALALQAQKAKSTTKAISLYREAIATYRELASAWNNLGVLLMEQQQYLDAAEAFTTASELEPTDPRPLYNLGLTWEQAGYITDALRFYGESLKRDPQFQPALRGAIRAERLLGRASDETLRRLRIALGQERDEQWRQWFEMQRPQVEAEVYAKGEAESMRKTGGE